MPFDAKHFENLSGHELGRYAIRLVEEKIAEGEFLPYFTQEGSRMDALHLESALFILGKIGSVAAYHKVVECLEHTEFSVQFAATRIIANIPTADAVVMRYVTESLSKHDGDPTALAQELRPILDRAANDEARCIAEEYRRKSVP